MNILRDGSWRLQKNEINKRSCKRRNKSSSQIDSVDPVADEGVKRSPIWIAEVAEEVVKHLPKWIPDIAEGIQCVFGFRRLKRQELNILRGGSRGLQWKEFNILR